MLGETLNTNIPSPFMPYRDRPDGPLHFTLSRNLLELPLWKSQSAESKWLYDHVIIVFNPFSPKGPPFDE